MCIGISKFACVGPKGSTCQHENGFEHLFRIEFWQLISKVSYNRGTLQVEIITGVINWFSGNSMGLHSSIRQRNSYRGCYMWLLHILQKHGLNNRCIFFRSCIIRHFRILHL